MFPKNPLVLMQLAEDQSRSFRRESEKQRMLREAERRQPSGLSAHTYRAVSAFGHLLVDLGRHLESLAASRDAYLAGQDSACETVQVECRPR